MKKNPKMKYLIDTNVLIELFRQNPETENPENPVIGDYFADLPLNKRFTTDMNVLELYNGAKRKDRPKEIEKIDLFLTEESIKSIPITRKDSKKAIELMKKYTPIIGLEDKDALIAAISLNRNCHLITIDKVFNKINLRAEKFEKLKKDGLKVITLSGYEERGIINV